MRPSRRDISQQRGDALLPWPAIDHTLYSILTLLQEDSRSFSRMSATAKLSNPTVGRTPSPWLRAAPTSVILWTLLTAGALLTAFVVVVGNGSISLRSLSIAAVVMSAYALISVRQIYSTRELQCLVPVHHVFRDLQSGARTNRRGRGSGADPRAQRWEHQLALLVCASHSDGA